MLLREKGQPVGITCDFCGTAYKQNFSYYSVEATQVLVTNNQRANTSDAKFSHDVCDGCYVKWLDRVRGNLAGKGPAKSIKDDFSKNFLSGSYKYYILNFDMATVNIDSKDKITTDKQVMDLNLSERSFGELVEQAGVIRKKLETQGTWS
jgi:hypothetical protein